MTVVHRTSHRSPWVDAADALHDRSRRFGSCIDAMPSWAWVVAAIAAAWPSLAWTARRFVDGSDDPLGLVALVALVVALVIARRRFDHEPRPGLLIASVVASLVAAWPGVAMPDLVRALVANTSIALVLAAIVDDDEPFAAYAGLVLLALPLLSSLQFYAGYPLRVVTAEASRWLLAMSGSLVERTGSALVVDGRTILVDAPCSGVQMAWVGWFTACAAAWCFRLSDRAALARLPVVGLAVLAGNIVRNTLLVMLEAAGDVPRALHAGVGLAVLAMVVLVIASVFGRSTDRVRAIRRVRVATSRRACIVDVAPTNVARVARGMTAVLFGIAALLPLASSKADVRHVATAVEYPTVLDDAPLVPVALSEVEQRFVASFPGTIARFTNANRVVVLRDVERPTRRLHPATDCYRALGYAIDDERLVQDARARRWRCFAARRGGSALSVCERIVDVEGHAFTDASSWYWSAVFARSIGPWRATTIATPLAVARGDR